MSSVRNLTEMPSVAGTMLSGLLRARDGVPEDPGTLKAATVQLDGMRLDPARVARYRQACGFAAGPHMPVTWPFVWLFPLQLEMLTAPGWPIRPVGMVHLGVDFHLHRPLQDGEVVTGRCRLGAACASPRGLEFEMLLDLDGLGGDPVWRGQSRVLARSARNRRRTSSREPQSDSSGPELQPVGRFTASPRTSWEYARASSDWNPIHLGWLGARPFGFRQPIAHGMWSVARALAVLGLGDGAEPASVEAVFKAPMYLPAHVDVLVGPVETMGRRFELAEDGGRTLVSGRAG